MNKHRAQAPLRRFDEDRWWRYCLWATRAAGPTAVKLAQWASSREDRFPRAFCDRFAHLQDRAPAHAWRDTERALEASLGPDWRDVLDVDAAPVGTGCVAQVHSAVRGGVLFFGVVQAVETTTHATESRQQHRRRSSRKTSQTAAAGATASPSRSCTRRRGGASPRTSTSCGPARARARRSSRAPSGSTSRRRRTSSRRRSARRWTCARRAAGVRRHVCWLLRGEPRVDGVAGGATRRRLREKPQSTATRDQPTQEADNLERLRENFRNQSSVSFPAPRRALVSEDVLVEDFVEGPSMREYLKRDVDDARRKALARVGVDAVCKMIFHDNLLHGDLHPGNILVTRDATRDPAVCFLDAGICVELGAKEHVHLVRVLSALMRHDGDAAGRLLCKGMDGARAMHNGFDSDQAWQRAQDSFCECMRDITSRSVEEEFFNKYSEYAWPSRASSCRRPWPSGSWRASPTPSTPTCRSGSSR